MPFLMIINPKSDGPAPRDGMREFEPAEPEVPSSGAPRRADGVIVWASGDARSSSPRPRAPAKAHTSEKVDILFLAANPRSTKKLALEQEAQEVFRKVERVRRLERKLLLATRIDDLTHNLLRHRPTVVHFGGHGNRDGKLFLEDEEGDTEPVDVAALGRLLGDVGGVRCVVLNACFSAEQASVIARHVPCVVGMRAAIADTAAIAFAGTFYEALAFGEGVERAFRLACSGIDLHDLPDADVPRLLFREGVDPAEVRLFDEPVDEPIAPPHEPAPHPHRDVIAAVGLILVIMAVLAVLRAAV